MSTATVRPASGIPSYLRPAPARVFRLKPWQWTTGILLVGALAIEVVARLNVVSRVTLIPFTEMLVAAGQLLVSPSFYTIAVVPSLTAILMAFVISSAGGVAGGYLLWRIHPLRQALDPYLTAYYALPIFALYPMLVAIWGQGPGPITALAALFSIVAVIMNSMNGFDSAPPIIGKLARSMQVSERAYFLKFFLPYAMPYILIGLRLAFLYSLLSVLAAEFLLSSSGLGFFVNNAYVRFDIPAMYGGIVVIFALSIGAERLITFAVHKLTWVGALA